MELIKIEQAGVVGAGGAGFPTHVKLSGKAEILLVNAAECEPLLSVDQNLIIKNAKRLKDTLAQVAKHLDAKQTIVAIKKKHEEAIAALQKEKLQLCLLDNFYPAGDEQITVYEVTGRTVPEGGIPLAVGVVVLNVETVLNIANALEDKPVTHTCLTVTGEVARPLTAYFPIGMRADEVIAYGGGAKIKEWALIEGGPAMGNLKDPLEPITKTTKGLIVLPKDHPLVQLRERSLGSILRQASSACCQCQLCTELCPRYLLGHSIDPARIMRAMAHGTADIEGLTSAMLCSECGLCDLFACPMGLSPRRVNQALKAEFGKQGLKNPHHQDVKPRSSRPGRKAPTARLISRLALSRYDLPAPWQEAAVSPREVTIPLKQHIGKPAKPVVKVGQYVEQGELIAKADGLGANIHASCRGRVESISGAIVIGAR
jgi:Na+-translocating ferredoxin:NAD+ oxidoreductase RnfC subunit